MSTPIPHHETYTDVHPDADRIRELADAALSTERVYRQAESAYQMATRDSAYTSLDEDPHVLATRDLRDLAQRAHAAAVDRLDEVLTFAPLVLTGRDVTPQSRRSLETWTRGRGSGEVLPGAVRQILVALAHGKTVTITVE